MIERIIRNNIKNLNYHLVMGYLESKNVYPTEDEAIIITNFLKENYKIILKNNIILMNLKCNIRYDIYYSVTNILMNLKKDYL